MIKGAQNTEVVENLYNFDASELTEAELSELCDTFSLYVPEVSYEGSNSSESSQLTEKPCPKHDTSEGSETDRDIQKNNKRLAKELAKAFGELDADPNQARLPHYDISVPSSFKENTEDYIKEYYIGYLMKRHKATQEKEEEKNREIELFYSAPSKPR